MREGILIYLVDDDDIFQFAAERLIEIELGNINIKVFSDGEEAINFIRENMEENSSLIPDLILLDINMPRMNGFEFIEEFKKIKDKLQQVSIYMVSSSIDPDDLQKAKELVEITDYIVKPLERDVIRKIYDDFQAQY